MKKLLIFVFSALLLTVTACKEKSSYERVEVVHDKPVIVAPEKKVDVTIHNDTAPAPVIINHESKTNTTTKSDENGSVTTETHSESVH